jgi:tetratricopeptide (TPR) repeat protein
VTASRIALTVAFLIYGVIAVPSGLDRMSRKSPALEGAVPPPFRAQADRSAAATALVRKQTDAALAESQAAVAHDPVDADSTALLGTALLEKGRYEEADRAFRVAARFGWRNPATQAYWLDVSVQSRAFELAADRADAILRAHPGLADERQLLAPFEVNPAGRKILANRLRARPPWTEQYIAVPKDMPAETVEQRFQIIAQLDANPPLGCSAIAPLVRDLIRIGRRPDAQQLWNKQCPGRKVSGNLGDPAFAFVLADYEQDMPFSWVIWRSGDIDFEQERASGETGALAVTNSSQTARIALYQPIALPPGRYLVRASGTTEPSSKVTAAFACDGHFPLTEKPEGNILVEGQVVTARECTNQQLGLWVSGNNSTVRLRSIELTTAK